MGNFIGTERIPYFLVPMILIPSDERKTNKAIVIISTYLKKEK